MDNKKSIFNPVAITGRDLGDTWVRLMYETIENGRAYVVTEGSHAGDIRVTADVSMGVIMNPEIRPFAPQAKPGQAITFTDDGILEYFEKYVYRHGEAAVGINEDYNYSRWLTPLADAIMKYSAKFGNGNAHCTMRVGDPFCFLGYFDAYDNEMDRKTTPCLLDIDTKVVDGKLVFYVFYRSWDLLNGFPMNLGGFQLLKEAMAVAMGLLPGATVFMCKDLHLYGNGLKAAADWTGHYVTNVHGKMLFDQKILDYLALIPEEK
jgi:hypothetical protein